MPDLLCACDVLNGVVVRGVPMMTGPCPFPATQEDGLCDSCRDHENADGSKGCAGWSEWFKRAVGVA